MDTDFSHYNLSHLAMQCTKLLCCILSIIISIVIVHITIFIRGKTVLQIIFDFQSLYINIESTLTLIGNR